MRRNQSKSIEKDYTGSYVESKRINLEGACTRPSEKSHAFQMDSGRWDNAWLSLGSDIQIVECRMIYVFVENDTKY